MNSQFSTALLVMAGAGLATMLLFSIIHTSFRSALMPKAISTSADRSDTYFDRIY